MLPRPSQRAGLFAAVILAASCSSPERPHLSNDTLPGPNSGLDSEQGSDQDVPGSVTAVAPTIGPGWVDGGDPESVGNSSLAADGALINLPLGSARALITPTGVVVPVLSDDGTSYTVMTPCGDSATLAWGTPLYEAQVVLDPGHGGEVETGAVGANGLTEKELNLRLAKRTARILQERGISVVLTRTSDYRIPLVVRAEIGNRLDAELMVSIHHNAPNWQPSDIPGTEVFVQKDTPESRRLGGLIWEEVVAALAQFDDVEWTAADDAGALEVLNAEGGDTYGMVRRPLMPAVLAEFGYISNASEAELFATDDYIDVSATALAEAIWRWLATDDPGDGLVDEPRLFTPTGGTGGTGGCIDPALE